MHFPSDPGLGDTARFVGRMVIAVGILAIAAALWVLKDVLLLIFAGVLFSIILNAAADGIERLLRLRHDLALGLATIILFGLGGGATYLFGHEISVQLQELAARLPEALDDARALLASAGVGPEVNGHIARALPDGKTILNWATYLVSSVSGALSGLFVAIVGGIYCAAQPHVYHRGLLLLLPGRYWPAADEAMRATGRALRAWLLGQLLSMAFTGILITLGLVAIGMPSALALGLIAGLMGFVPMIGPLIGAAPGVLVALTVDTHSFLLTVLLYFVVQQLAGNVVEPLIMQRAVLLPPALTLFALFGTGTLFGVVGVLLAGPLLVSFYVLIRHLYVRNALGHDLEPGSG
jgi:predicted PurR-regulated permease PerM